MAQSVGVCHVNMRNLTESLKPASEDSQEDLSISLANQLNQLIQVDPYKSKVGTDRGRHSR